MFTRSDYPNSSLSVGSGGFVIIKKPLVKKNVHAHTGVLERPVSPADLCSLNAVQNTRWKINGRVLAVMREAWDRRLPIAGINKAVYLPLLGEKNDGRLPDDVWNAMTKEQRAAHRKELARIHSVNASVAGRERAFLDILSVAHEMRDRPAIWFPHNRCFRGRIHPITSRGPSPQSADAGKALLQFADGLRLDIDGEFWLAIRAANCAGKDKLALGDRVMWTMENAGNIRESALDPFRMADWWGAMDEPWSFLATCFELSDAWYLDNPENFVSYLPVPMDGTCNGLQHLSAMGLDEVGAQVTNLRALETRSDIYEEVASIVKHIVERDAQAGIPCAAELVGKINRKTVKRAVMTTPYGVTQRGIREQFFDDSVLSKGQSSEATYLTEAVVAALADSVQAANVIMGWLQNVAGELGKAGLPFDWITPTGSRVRQAYLQRNSYQVQTLVGRLRIDEEIASSTISTKKQRSSASPNFIHSFDASHLSATVNRALDAGVTSFAVIHDSYGTHAAHTATLARVLREEFVRIYEKDWLEITRKRILTEHPHVELPMPPERGSFDIHEVLDAPFFFS